MLPASPLCIRCLAVYGIVLSRAAGNFHSWADTPTKERRLDVHLLMHIGHSDERDVTRAHQPCDQLASLAVTAAVISSVNDSPDEGHWHSDDVNCKALQRHHLTSARQPCHQGPSAGSHFCWGTPQPAEGPLHSARMSC